jgi:3-oxoacid CoA-transferase B subunit
MVIVAIDPSVRLSRAEIAAVLAQHMEPGWIVNLGIGIPTLAANYLDPEAGIILTSENGVVGYGEQAAEGDEDVDIVNASVEYTTLRPGAAIMHHADSFALIRKGMVDCVALGAYEVSMDGSFANWRTQEGPYDGLGGIGGAMDLAACSGQVMLAMAHTTREGAPRLMEQCVLPITAPRVVTRVITDLAVVAIRDGRFVLEQHALSVSVEEIASVTGAPLDVSDDLRPMAPGIAV